jgi:hypothetical protein
MTPNEPSRRGCATEIWSLVGHTRRAYPKSAVERSLRAINAALTTPARSQRTVEQFESPKALVTDNAGEIRSNELERFLRS